MFSMCLGKNGGFIQMGGFNSENHLEPVNWVKMSSSAGHNFKFELHSVAFNSHKISGSQKWSVAFVDSGTTFAYLPPLMWD